MITDLFDAVLSGHGTIILVLVVTVLIAIYWGTKGWETAKSLSQLIALSDVVCEICAKSSVALTNQDGHGDLTHQFVPAHLVFTPPERWETGNEGPKDTR